ncbi:MAG: primosomal protein N' [Candidatus Omnitrophica bacterium]|nr:primosomal protein N' [Candidatus Omnitrophota bacterium]
MPQLKSAMKYARVVVGLPVDGPFDYSIPDQFFSSIKVGSRVRVQFGARKTVGYVVGLCPQPSVVNVKPLLQLLDEWPVFGARSILLARSLSQHYASSLGEALVAMLPDAVRRGKPVTPVQEDNTACVDNKPGVTLLHDLEGDARFKRYVELIAGVIARKKTVVVLAPDLSTVTKLRDMMQKQLSLACAVVYRNQDQELLIWQQIRQGEFPVVIGMRSAIFTPLPRLGLIIMDEEHDVAYKQDQAPHYHAREIALMRAGIEKAQLVFASHAPSLELMRLVVAKKIQYERLDRNKMYPVVDLDRPFFSRGKAGSDTCLSSYLINSLSQCLEKKEKVLLFVNRRGFATFAFCKHCQTVLQCPRCASSLIYHYKHKRLSCQHCSYSSEVTQICPRCNAGYIRYSGIGTEKIESELARLFPAARIKRLEEADGLQLDTVDICIATQAILKKELRNFDLVGVLAIDNILHHADFRSAEKVFALLVGLTQFTTKRMIVQTSLVEHHCMKAIKENKPDIFYSKELAQRKQANLPPFKRLAYLRLRGIKEERVKERAEFLYDYLREIPKPGIEVVAAVSGQPLKLRNKFCWHIVMRAASAKQVSRFLKERLKGVRHAGVNVTIDVDPI